MSFLYNNDLIDEFFEKVDDYIRFEKDHGEWEYYFSINKLKFELSISQKRSDSLMNEIKRVYDHAKAINDEYGIGVTNYCLGYAYLATQRPDEAEKYFREAMNCFSRNPSYFMDLLAPTYVHLGEVYVAQGRYAEIAEIYNQWSKSIDRFEKERMEERATFAGKVYRFPLYMQYTELYIQTGDLEKANVYIEKSEQSITTESLEKPLVEGMRAKLYSAEGNYEKALEHINAQIETTENKFNLEPLELKMHILLKMNKVEEAKMTLETFFENYKETRTKELTQELDELATLYEVDKINAEKEFFKRSLVLALVILLIIIVFLITVIIYRERMRRKNHVLYTQIKKNIQDDNKPNENKSAISDNSSILAVKLGKVMHEDKLFKDINLTRKSLADYLGTNETYLADTIREVFGGVTFLEYITSLRLEYSCKLLIENNQYTIEAIAKESGFGSAATFFRAFKKEYEMSPGDFRKMRA